MVVGACVLVEVCDDSFFHEDTREKDKKNLTRWFDVRHGVREEPLVCRIRVWILVCILLKNVLVFAKDYSWW